VECCPDPFVFLEGAARETRFHLGGGGGGGHPWFGWGNPRFSQFPNLAPHMARVTPKIGRAHNWVKVMPLHYFDAV
jgi:hypothetical protein